MGMSGSYDEEHAIEEEEEVDMEDERDEEMGAHLEEYGDEVDQLEASLGFDQFKQIIECNEDEKKNQAMQARQDNFIRKKSYIH